jgi:hypothetical protein
VPFCETFFSSKPTDLAEWINSSKIAHCLSALGIVSKEQPPALFVMKMETTFAWGYPFYSVDVFCSFRTIRYA